MGGIAMVKKEELLNLECEGCQAILHHIYEGGKCKRCGKIGCTHPDCVGYGFETQLCKACRFETGQLEDIDKDDD